MRLIRTTIMSTYKARATLTLFNSILDKNHQESLNQNQPLCHPHHSSLTNHTISSTTTHLSSTTKIHQPPKMCLEIQVRFQCEHPSSGSFQRCTEYLNSTKDSNNNGTCRFGEIKNIVYIRSDCPMCEGRSGAGKSNAGSNGGSVMDGVSRSNMGFGTRWGEDGGMWDVACRCWVKLRWVQREMRGW